MPRIEIGRWAELLKRIAGIAGAERVSGDYSPEVSPIFLLEDLNHADFLFLKSVRLAYGSSSLNAAVGFTAKWRLRNPATSGVIARVRYVEMTASGADLFVRVTINQQTVDFPTVVTARVPDLRWEATDGMNQTALILTASNAAASGPAGGTLYFSRSPLGTTRRFAEEIPLLPGSAIDWGTESLNVALLSNVGWTERALPDLER